VLLWAILILNICFVMTGKVIVEEAEFYCMCMKNTSQLNLTQQLAFKTMYGVRLEIRL